ncbi:murein biosynthesis integral membrane protein MurJ [Blastochloris sulfoviridis]|uniref:Probable lipid II flippase MurJ n=1 Tax=Blastochloris sulfoviridis TaxID=50712 RepID=A0A5M6I562_9HYPH|nr:murein biosynthesis integral membrane protein MurJ [Blastochloris sulfoviridis]KAA5602955.1 murein biosynthesis integral membrane protein MurJ [Blastochloris sulfoviridis]
MSLLRKVSSVGAATLVSRVLGFVRDALMAAVLGAGPLADAFVAAFQLPNLARRLLAEGALNAAFVPAWLTRRAEAGPEAARAFTGRVFGSLAAVLAGLAALAALFMPQVVGLIAPGFAPQDARFALAVGWARWTVGYVVLAGLVAVLAGVLNATGRVGAAAALPIAFNVVMIAALAAALFGGMAETPAAGTLLALAVLLAGLVQLALVGVAAARLPVRPLDRPCVDAGPDMRRFFRRAGPGLIAAGIPQIKFFAAVAIASGVPGAASYLWYADRLYELPLGIVAAIAAGVLVPVLAAHARAADGAALGGAQSRAVEFAAGLALPAAVGLVLLADPIARTLFERGAFGPADSAATAAVLAAMAFGLPGHVLEKVFAAGAYAHTDTATPMMTALAGLVVAIAGGVLLLPAFGAAGVAAAMAASGWVNAASLAAIEARRGRLRLDRSTPRTLAKVVAAAALMALALALVRELAAGLLEGGTAARVLALTALIGCGGAVYAAAVQAMGAFDLAQLAGLRGRRT